MRRRADKGDTGLLTGFCKFGILGEKAIPRVNGLNLAALGKGNDLVDRQVSAQRTSVFPNEVGLVRFGTKQSQCIFLGVNGKCADA